MLNLLDVETAEDRQFTMIENVYAKYFDYTMTGIEDIVGQKGKHSIRDWFERLNAKVLKPLLVKHAQRNVFDASQIVRAYNKIAFQEAMDVVKMDRQKWGLNCLNSMFKPQHFQTTVRINQERPNFIERTSDAFSTEGHSR